MLENVHSTVRMEALSTPPLERQLSGPLLWQPVLRACMSAPETLYKWKTQNTALTLTHQ